SRRLASILDQTSDMVVTATLQGRVLGVNAAGRRLLGVAPSQDLTGAAFEAFYTPESARTIRDVAIPAALEHGRRGGDAQLLARDGGTIPVSQLLMVHGDDPHGSRYLSAVARDMRERASREQALAEGEALFRSLAEHSAVGILRLSEKGRVL